MIGASIVNALESIIGRSTCDNFKRRELKVEKFFDKLRVEIEHIE